MANRNVTRNEYISGNTVRKLEPYNIPAQKDRERRAAQERKAAIRRNRQKQMAIDAGFMLFLTFAVMATMVVCINFIRLKADVERATKDLATVKEEVIDLRAKNDAAYNKVLTSINYEEIRNIATKEYGMVPAGQNQIIEYTSDMEDYMNQYKVVTG